MTEKEEILRNLENEVMMHIGTNIISKIVQRENNFNKLKLTEKLEINILIERLYHNPERYIS